MVHIKDFPEEDRTHILSKACKPFLQAPFVEGPPLKDRRVALVTTGGLHLAEDKQFLMVDLSYRVLPGNIRGEELSMTHSSVHFDRLGFKEDVNVVFFNNWFWQDTAVAGLIAYAAGKFLNHPDAMICILAERAMVPRSYKKRNDNKN